MGYMKMAALPLLSQDIYEICLFRLQFVCTADLQLSRQSKVNSLRTHGRRLTSLNCKKHDY